MRPAVAVWRRLMRSVMDFQHNDMTGSGRDATTAFPAGMGSLDDPIRAGNAVDSTIDACPCRRTTVRRCGPVSTSPGHDLASTSCLVVRQTFANVSSRWDADADRKSVV